MVEGIRMQPTMPTTIPNKVQPPTQRSDGKVRKNNRQLLAFVRVTKSLWKHKYSWPFMEPVDAVDLNIPHYYTVITNPMDLGTIKKRLENNYYDSAEECLQDYRLMFQNCYTFNKSETDVYIMAQTLESLLESKLKTVPPSEKGEPFHYDVRQATMQRQLPPSEDSYESETSSIGSLKRMKSVSKRRRHTSSSSESDFSSSSYPKKKNTKVNILKNSHTSDGQKENKPENVMQRKDAERVEQVLVCFKMFRKIYLKKNKPWPFVKPAVPIAFAEPDLDIGIYDVKKRLKKGEYDNIYHFCNDMIRVFKNQNKYVYPWTNSLKLAECFSTYLQKKNFRHSFKVIANENVAKKDNATVLSENIEAKSEKTLKENVANSCNGGKNDVPAYNPINTNINQSNPVKKRGRPKKNPVPSSESIPTKPNSKESLSNEVLTECRPMTEEEADILNEQLCTIGPSGVNQILQFIRETMPELLISKSGDFEVDFENAPPKIQWQIKNKIEEILANYSNDFTNHTSNDSQAETPHEFTNSHPRLKNKCAEAKTIPSKQNVTNSEASCNESQDECKKSEAISLKTQTTIEQSDTLDIIDVVSNSPDRTLIVPKNDPSINQQTEKWLSSITVPSPLLKSFKKKSECFSSSLKASPSNKAPELSKETLPKSCQSENSKVKINGNKDLNVLVSSFCKDESKLDISPKNDKVLHINEALIPRKTLNCTAMRKPIFYPVISQSEAVKERMKQLSRQHRQNYAKQHAVNLCINQETQHYFDMLVGNYSR